MVVFNVPRAGRYESNYTKKLVHNMFHANYVLLRLGFGVCSDDVENIVASFAAIHNLYSKINLIKTHYFELFVDYETNKETVFKVAELIGRMLYNNGFQNFITVADTGDEYLIAVAFNAVSYQNGRLFHDNNACYYEILKFISGLFSKKTKISITENTFFDPKERDGNYCHGFYG